MNSEFVPALELNAGFYRDAVAPLVAPFPHSAAHLGWGSDILGFDTERSTDHGWGPRLHVFVDAGDVAAARTAVDAGLPDEYAGWPVRFGWDEVEQQHHVYVGTLAAWLTNWLGCDPVAGLTSLDWLTMPQQRLLGVTRGAVYHDDAGALGAVRADLATFPPAIRLWILACQWQRLGQEEHFVGRTAQVGDELGARLLTARIVTEVMRLHFLLADTYWPYVKWFGSAYKQLPGSDALGPMLEAAVDARDHSTREDALVAAYEAIATMHNDAALTEPVEPSVRPFYERPFRTLRSERFVAACRDALTDDWLRAQPLIGSIDQIIDATDVLQYPDVYRRVRALYSH